MRKLLAIVVGLLSFVVITLSASYFALHTKYAAQVVNTALKYAYNGKIQVRDVTYSYEEPRHIQLNGVLIKQENDSTNLVEQVDIWLDKQIWAKNKLQIYIIVIDGTQLQSGWPQLALPNYVQLQQLAMVNIDFSGQGWVARDMNIQIKQPKPSDSSLFPFYGEILFSADQLYWQGEALDKVYLDGDITPTHSTFYDIRFQWRQGQFSAQATKQQTDTEWRLPQVSIAGLRFQQNDLDNISKVGLDSFEHIPMLIEDLNLYESSIESSLFSANNIKLNARNLRLPLQIWQQHDMSLFATADNMSFLDQTAQSPSIDISFQPDTINIRDMSLEMLEGNLHLQGSLTPTSLNLTQLNINNMKWFPTAETKQYMTDYLQQLEHIQAKMVTVNNVQFIDLTTTPNKLASGLSIEGDNIEIKKDKQWGLWRGQLTISASNASYDNVNSKTPIISMRSVDGHFWLDKLFVPLDNGLVKGTADMAFNKTSQPWNVDFEGYGIPLRFFSRWFDLPINLDGITDFTVKGTGLYGDELIFNHSVTGKLEASVASASTEDNFQTIWQKNQGVNLEPLVPPQPKENTSSTEEEPSKNAEAKPQTDEKKTTQLVTISDIDLVADRGRVSLKPFTIDGEDFSAHVGGEYDFLYPEKGNIQYQLKGQCQTLTYNLLGDKNSVQVENDCH